MSVGPGWVVIFSDENGAPGEMVGYAPVHDGFNADIPVFWKQAPMPGWYFVQLFKDEGTVGKFEYPGPDKPVLGANGNPVTTRFFLVDYNGGARIMPTIGLLQRK